LILLRHGESEWNVEERFAGWVDVHLTTVGEHEAGEAGRLLAAAGLLPDVVHTSLLHRAVRTADLALEACGRDWIPVRRTWRLNERHYGALQGRTRADAIEEYGRSSPTRRGNSLTRGIALWLLDRSPGREHRGCRSKARPVLDRIDCSRHQERAPDAGDGSRQLAASADGSHRAARRRGPLESGCPDWDAIGVSPLSRSSTNRRRPSAPRTSG
jgi:hypothetical protein